MLVAPPIPNTPSCPVPFKDPTGPPPSPPEFCVPPNPGPPPLQLPPLPPTNPPPSPPCSEYGEFPALQFLPPPPPPPATIILSDNAEPFNLISVAPPPAPP